MQGCQIGETLLYENSVVKVVDYSETDLMNNNNKEHFIINRRRHGQRESERGHYHSLRLAPAKRFGRDKTETNLKFWSQSYKI